MSTTEARADDKALTPGDGLLPAARFRTAFTVAQAALAFAGAGIAGTLWQADLRHEDLPCTSDGGCAVVAASRWSHLDLIVIHHVPVALLGLLGYVFLLSAAMLRLGTDSDIWNRRLHLLIGLVSGGGVLYSWYLQWVAHADLGVFCVWCRSSAVVMTLLFGSVVWEWLYTRSQRGQTHG